MRILYRDARLLAVDKPAGLLVHRSPLDRGETRFALQQARALAGQRLWPVHRLDKATSGLLLFALDADAARCVGSQFEQQGVANDLTGQMAALRDLGALPRDTDLQAVIRDLRLDQAPIDPTTLTGEEMVAEVQRVVKALLGYGARMPKELMLYVKNMVFLDGAIARLAPDLDLLAEVANISMVFAQRHGEKLMRDIGIDASAMQVDLDSVKAGLGVDLATERLTYRELQQRRELIQKRMRSHVESQRR